MFRLEKVFQNDDSGYILFSNFIKSLTLFFHLYILILRLDNSIYELIYYKILKILIIFLFIFIINKLFYIIIFFKK